MATWCMRLSVGVCIVSLLSVTVLGCAKKSNDIQATYVSPLQYQAYNCDQVGQEMARVSRKVGEVSGAQDKAASKDAVAMGVGMVVFWPALFFLIGGDRKDELARLKGEHEALEQVAIQNNCTTILAQLEADRERMRVAEKQETQRDDDLLPHEQSY